MIITRTNARAYQQIIQDAYDKVNKTITLAQDTTFIVPFMLHQSFWQQSETPTKPIPIGKLFFVRENAFQKWEWSHGEIPDEWVKQ